MVLSGYKNWIITKLYDVYTYIETSIQLCTVLVRVFQDQPVFVHYTGMHFFQNHLGIEKLFCLNEMCNELLPAIHI